VSKARPARKADSLTAIFEPIVYIMWDPQRLTTLWTFTTCYLFLTLGHAPHEHGILLVGEGYLLRAGRPTREGQRVSMSPRRERLRAYDLPSVRMVDMKGSTLWPRGRTSTLPATPGNTARRDGVHTRSLCICTYTSCTPDA
jgi:hypothetical protein